jgi:hypothetical protein
MTTTIRFLTLLMLVFIIGSQSLVAQKKKYFYGSWNFDAPTAPPGYEIGVITITSDSVFTKYPNYINILKSSFVSFQNDTLTFIFNPAVEVTIKLTVKNKKLLTGEATWMSDESVITLTKIQPDKSKKQKGK